MFSKKTIFVLMVITIFVWYPIVTETSIVKEGLISYWTLDQSTISDKESLVEDVFGDHDGTIMGGPEIVEGAIGQALHFGGNDSVVVESNEGLKLVDAFTIETWVKGDAAPEDGPVSRWLLKGQNDGANFRFTWDGDDTSIQTDGFGLNQTNYHTS